ncbi:MAG: LysR family transcriptional regulator [Ilumatobacteraceae bacterium]
MTIELRHLRWFLAIAEERNLTRAAARMHVGQPTLSRALAQLERELGVRLVDRSTHHLELTEAGHAFERDAFETVQNFERTIARAGGSVPPLRLGHSWSSSSFLTAIAKAWGAVPGRPCPLVIVRSEDRNAALTTGGCDVALTRGPVDRRRFRTVTLVEEPRVAVLPADHRLATRRSVRLEELADGALVQTTVGITTPELWPGAARPSVAAVVNTVDDWLIEIACGNGFGVSVTSTAVLHPHPEVRYVPVPNAPPVPLFLAWPRSGAHPAVKELLAAASSIEF